MLSLIHQHRGALLSAFCVGLLYLLPHLFFIFSLGNEYRGIPLIQTPNEESYYGRIHEVIDGHGALGSSFFYEYKNMPPLSPSVGEWLYALPSVIFGIPLVFTVTASKFLLPTLLFLLIYALVWWLIGGGGRGAKIHAIVSGLLVVLGYDLIDYRTVLSYLSGVATPDSFLLWSRPINPILGALFLFSFLLLLYALFLRRERPFWRLCVAAFLIACMFGSYFFSWGMAISVLAVLVCVSLIRREYTTACLLSLVVPLGALIAAPYWITVFTAHQSPWYAASVLRSGLFLTHYPLLNKLLLATLLFFILACIFDFVRKKRSGVPFVFEPWQWFSLALLLGGLWAFSQQVITGMTVWPYHFVQYTIPFSIIVVMVLLYRIIREQSKVLWASALVVAGLASVIFGVYTQVSVYTSSYAVNLERQSLSPLFAWLNAQEKDCVVFVDEVDAKMTMLNMLIPGFTHCNRYSSTELYSLIPEERGWYNYLALLRLRGVSAGEIEEYVRTHEREATGYLYSNWQGLFGIKDFPDFSDALLPERLAAFPQKYKEFLAEDFKSELLRYRLDYIVAGSARSANLQMLLGGRAPLYQRGDLSVYGF